MINDLKPVIIIPAKGDSQRFPGKNVSKINGVPLIVRAARVAKEAAKIIGADVYVNTNSREILNMPDLTDIVSTVLRPEGISDDVNKVLKHDFCNIPNEWDIAVFSHCTAPFIQVQTLVDMYNIVATSVDVSSCITMIREALYLWRQDTYDTTIFPLWDTSTYIPSQDREPFFVETHAVYVFKIDKFLDHGCVYIPPVVPYITSKLEAVDINEREDYELVKRLADGTSWGYI